MAVKPLEAIRQFSVEAGPLEEAFGQKARLSIMACLLAAERLSFLTLKQDLHLTDGNLSTHLSYLERKGYLVLEKGFRGKRPYTEALLTDGGREAFEHYIRALETWITALSDAK